MHATRGVMEALEDAEEANHSEAMLHKLTKGATYASPVAKKDTLRGTAQIKGLTRPTSSSLMMQTPW